MCLCSTISGQKHLRVTLQRVLLLSKSQHIEDLGFVLAVVALCCQATQSRTITIYLKSSLAKTEYKCNFYVTGSACGKLVILVCI